MKNLRALYNQHAQKCGLKERIKTPFELLKSEIDYKLAYRLLEWNDSLELKFCLNDLTPENLDAMIMLMKELDLERGE